MMAVVLAVTIGALQVGSAVIARHQAQAAADVAALAAARVMPAGLTAACDGAAAVARAMSTVVTACAADDLDVMVTVEARVPLALLGLGAARATAQAGPAARV